MLRPLYKNFKEDYINFWDILNVPKFSSPLAVDNAYSLYLKKHSIEYDYVKKSEHIDEAYVAWKLLRDKYFEKAYIDCESLSQVYAAGFFLDSFDLFEELGIQDFNLPMNPIHKIKKEISNKKKNIVLISTGGFSPVHDGHIYTLEIAKKELEKRGYNVLAGYLSPSHDDYVSTKDNGLAHNPALNRIRLINEKVKNSTWISAATHESVYTRTSINFTDVVYNLKKYLQFHFDFKFDIGYVFGGDNAHFIRAFQDEDMAICVSRNHENESIFQEDNIEHLNYIYVKDNPHEKLSSTKIRQFKKDISKNENSKNYLIRDDFYFYKDIPNSLSPINKLKSIFKNYLPYYDFILLDVKKQFNYAEKKKKQSTKKTLSLDVYSKGNYNLEISRKFNISESQSSAISFVSRPEYEGFCFKEFSQTLPEEDFVLIEDDIASGQTLSFVKKLIPDKSQIIDYILLSNYEKYSNIKKIDIVDLRDFIINAPFSGLVVEYKNNIFRVPYIQPYVDLFSRASIPHNKAVSFSFDILSLNYDFYMDIKNKGIEIELNSQTIKFFKSVNQYDNNKKGVDNILSFCCWQMNLLRRLI